LSNSLVRFPPNVFIFFVCSRLFPRIIIFPVTQPFNRKMKRALQSSSTFPASIYFVGEFRDSFCHVIQKEPYSAAWESSAHRKTSISGTTCSRKKRLSRTILPAICLDYSMLFDNLWREKVSKREGYLCFFCPAYRSSPVFLFPSLQKDPYTARKGQEQEFRGTKCVFLVAGAWLRPRGFGNRNRGR
jgi:hypothetical protein